MSIGKTEKMSTPHLKIADRVRKAIKSSNLTQVQFAKKIKIHTSSLSKYLAGQHAFSYEMLQKVVKYTNCDANWLLTGQPSKLGNKSIEKQRLDSLQAKEYFSTLKQSAGKEEMTEAESEYIKIAIDSMNKRIDGIEKVIESKLDLVFEKLTNMEKNSQSNKKKQKKNLESQRTA